ncbi:hypothetical protein BKA56DRAFT_84439 [Ilyonectria sp. MPI-CAGE-AT-0026]|nr:hypothetical protein BKA56DRAFT_84439 [Ilyonectria sp. MPI-CAGE-AT-0026]
MATFLRGALVSVFLIRLLHVFSMSSPYLISSPYTFSTASSVRSGARRAAGRRHCACPQSDPDQILSILSNIIQLCILLRVFYELLGVSILHHEWLRPQSVLNSLPSSPPLRIVTRRNPFPPEAFCNLSPCSISSEDLR